MFLVWAGMKDAARIVKTAPQKGEKENAAESARDFYEINDMAFVAQRQRYYGAGRVMPYRAANNLNN